MKKAIKNLILLLFVFAFCQSAFCYTLTPAELTKIINSEAQKHTKKLLGNMEYKLKISGIIQTDISTNEANKPKVELSGQNQTFSPISYTRVTIKDSKGNIVKSFPVNIQTLVYKDVLVAKDNIKFGEEINETNAKLEHVEISKYFNKTFDNFEDNLIASRNFVKGGLILKNYTKQKALITKNSDIDIVFISKKGIKIALRGKALKEGALGETIPVRSDKYNKMYNAKVESSSKVSVRI